MDQPPSPVQRFYVAPANNLAGGTILTGTVEGWASNPAAVILKEYNGTQTPLFHVSLPDGTKTPIVETVPQFEFGSVFSSPGALFVQPSMRQSEPVERNGDGSIAGRQNVLPRHITYEGGEEYRNDVVGTVGSRLYIFGANSVLWWFGFWVKHQFNGRGYA